MNIGKSALLFLCRTLPSISKITPEKAFFIIFKALSVVRSSKTHGWVFKHGNIKTNANVIALKNIRWHNNLFK